MCREKVKNSYVSEQHMPAIEQFCKEKKCRISFREAGDKSLARINAGHPCKGHEIEEKSIKEKTIKQAKSVKIDGALISKTPGAVEIREKLEPFSGMIGHWNQTKDGVEGIYVSQYALSADVKKAPPAWAAALTEIKAKGKTVTPLTSTLVKAMKDDPANAWPYFLTGDYDLHDLFVKEGSRWVTCSLQQEEQLLNELAIRLKRVHGPDLAYVPRSRDDEFSCIRHGAQINYCLHMVLEEKDNPLVYAVVTADHNVAFCDEDGKWAVCDSMESDPVKAQRERRGKYYKWYETRKLKVKSTFDGDTNVILDFMLRNVSLKDVCKTAVSCFFQDAAPEQGNAAAVTFLNQLKSAIPGSIDERGPVDLVKVKKKYSERGIFSAIEKSELSKDATLLAYARKYLESYYFRNPQEWIVFEKTV